MTDLTKEQARAFVKDAFDRLRGRMKQEFSGENEELLDRVVRQFRAEVSRCAWKAAQQWCKWGDEGPVLMPDYTRIYYRKGVTEVLVLEYPPQIRIMRYTGMLAQRANSTADLAEGRQTAVSQYSLALPYVVFIFKFVAGKFAEVRCAFSDRPLKRLEERPLRPYLSNIDSTLKVCLGRSFDESQLLEGQIVQQAAYVLSHFWQTVYSDEWSHHYWDNKKHFEDSDPRLATLEAWQAASVENPLFVVEDVPWLQHSEENFGDMVVRLFDGDVLNRQFQDDLYAQIVDTFLQNVVKTFSENLDSVQERAGEALLETLAAELAGESPGAA